MQRISNSKRFVVSFFISSCWVCAPDQHIRRWQKQCRNQAGRESSSHNHIEQVSRPSWEGWITERASILWPDVGSIWQRNGRVGVAQPSCSGRTETRARHHHRGLWLRTVMDSEWPGGGGEGTGESGAKDWAAVWMDGLHGGLPSRLREVLASLPRARTEHSLLAGPPPPPSSATGAFPIPSRRLLSPKRAGPVPSGGQPLNGWQSEPPSSLAAS